MRGRRLIGMLLVAAAILAIAGRHPVADIRILTHRAGDVAPARMEAAVELGVVGLNLLVTWSVHGVAIAR